MLKNVEYLYKIVVAIIYNTERGEERQHIVRNGVSNFIMEVWL